MNFIKTFFIGICVGVADIVPGLSAGTMVVAFDIYEQYVNSLTLNFKKIKENWKFLVPLLLGMFCGVFGFTNLITWLYKMFSVQTDFFFTGLVIGSIPLIFSYVIKDFSNKIEENSEIKEEALSEKKKVSVGKIISCVILVLIGFAIMMGIKILKKQFGGEVEFGIPEAVTVELLIISFIGGVLASIGMTVPGISGPLLLLMIGAYQVLIPCIPGIIVPKTFLKCLIILLPNGIGLLTGILLFAKLIRWVLKKSPNQLYSLILGLIVGTLFVIFPGFVFKSVAGGIMSFVCLIAGFCLVFFITRKTKK